MPYLSKRRAPSQLIRQDVVAYKKPRTSQNNSRFQPPTYARRTANTTEVKNVTGALTGYPISSSGNVLVFGRVANGSGDDERVGKAVKHLSFELRFRFERFSTYPWINFRVIVGIWKQALGGAVPATSDIVEQPGILQTPIKAENSSNMIILDDYYVHMPAMAASGSPAALAGDIKFNEKKYKRSFTQEYNGTTSSDVTNWHHFVYVAQDNVGSGGSQLYTQNFYTDS